MPPTPPGAPINRTLQTFADTGALTCTVTERSAAARADAEPDRRSPGTPTTPGNYVFTVRCTDANGKVDEQTLSMQIDPAAPAGFDALWNGADTELVEPEELEPARRADGDGSRVYISAATTVVPRLTPTSRCAICSSSRAPRSTPTASR